MSENRNQSRVGLVIGLILVALGILFLIGQFLTFDVGNLFWPLFVIIPGLILFVIMLAGGRKLAPMAIPASIVTMVGLILFYQNLFDYFESWAYAWALIPVAVGIGLIISGLYSGNRREVEGGRQTLITGIILFIAFGAFFELVVGLSGQSRGGPLVWSILLIGAGILVFITTIWRGRRPEPTYRAPETPVTPGVDARYDAAQTTVLGRGTVETPPAYVPPVTPPVETLTTPVPERPIPVEPEPASTFEQAPVEKTTSQPETPRPVREEYSDVRQAPVLGRGVIEDRDMRGATPTYPSAPVEPPVVETPAAAAEIPPVEPPIITNESPAADVVVSDDATLHETYVPVEEVKTETAPAPFTSTPVVPTEPILEAWQPVGQETPSYDTTALPTAEETPEPEADTTEEIKKPQPGDDNLEGGKE